MTRRQSWRRFCRPSGPWLKVFGKRTSAPLLQTHSTGKANNACRRNALRECFPVSAVSRSGRPFPLRRKKNLRVPVGVPRTNQHRFVSIVKGHGSSDDVMHRRATHARPAVKQQAAVVGSGRRCSRERGLHGQMRGIGTVALSVSAIAAKPASRFSGCTDKRYCRSAALCRAAATC